MIDTVRLFYALLAMEILPYAIAFVALVCLVCVYTKTRKKGR